MTIGRGVPPQLTGFTFVEPIGQGGFADVFLYRDDFNRKVAIKVLIESALAGDGQEIFRAEANVMAQLSDHPSIVSIYQAGVSPDGRPYLVMEYCPSPNLAVRYRTDRIEVPEALEVSVKIASAVETAHRAGILHRDVKPHNILTTAYGSPMLTDFGIAATTHEANPDVAGVSVPWSPPEVFDDNPPTDPRSDVFSLAATTYTLLAGRSPFEVPGAANDNATLMSRIERQALPRINRGDIPDSLQRLLEQAMSKDISERPISALAYARGIQDVQIELGLSPTRIEVLDASGSDGGAPAGDENRTQVRPVSVIIPDAPEGTLLKPVVVPQRNGVVDHTQRRSSSSAPDTMSKPQVPVASAVAAESSAPGATDEAATTEPTARKTPLLAILGGVLIVALLVTAVVVALLWGESDDGPAPPTLGPATPVGPTTSVPLPPVDVVGTVSGSTATFTWENPEPEEGDSYLWRRVDAGADSTTSAVDEPQVTFSIQAGETPCIQVAVMRENRRSSNLQAMSPVCAGGAS